MHLTTSMKRTLVIYIFICAVILSACYYDVEPNTTCDMSNITYSGTVTSILNLNGCLTANCHGGTNPASGIKLTDYNSVKFMESRLYGSLNHSPGYIAMPENAGKISQCEIDKIKAWIDSGAPNN